MLPPFAELLGHPGVRRGSTVVVAGTDVPGGTSLLLALLAGPSREGAWCALVGASDLGLAAAAELGVVLSRLLLVPDPGPRPAQVAGALLDGCDLVCVRTPTALGAPDVRRLAARARERRTVLVVVTGRLPLPAARRGARSGWPDAPDVRLEVTAGRFSGPGQGDGRVTAHLVEVTAARRRGAPGELRRWLWLPGPDGGVALAGAGVPPSEAGTAADRLARAR